MATELLTQTSSGSVQTGSQVGIALSLLEEVRLVGAHHRVQQSPQHLLPATAPVPQGGTWHQPLSTVRWHACKFGSRASPRMIGTNRAA